MRTAKTNIEKNKREKAQSLVEFALTFSIIIFVLSGIIDFGRAFFTLISLNDAAQEGAMYGSMLPANDSDIEDRVRLSSTDPIDLTDTTAVKVYVNETTPGKLCAGLDASSKPYGIGVSVEYDFNFTMPFLTSMVPGNVVTLKGLAVHTILHPPCP